MIRQGHSVISAVFRRSAQGNRKDRPAACRIAGIRQILINLDLITNLRTLQIKGNRTELLLLLSGHLIYTCYTGRASVKSAVCVEKRTVILVIIIVIVCRIGDKNACGAVQRPFRIGNPHESILPVIRSETVFYKPCPVPSGVQSEIITAVIVVPADNGNSVIPKRTVMLSSVIAARTVFNKAKVGIKCIGNHAVIHNRLLYILGIRHIDSIEILQMCNIMIIRIVNRRRPRI